MQPEGRDAAQLWMMVKPARYLVRTGNELSLARLQSDEEKQYSVAKALELIGEAVRRLSDGFLAAHPSIPWGPIKGMRHHLVHEYHRVDWDLVWTTIRVHVPEFLAQIEALLPDPPPGEAEDNPL
jgi:uncharacterized protein with HEPN domain